MANSGPIADNEKLEILRARMRKACLYDSPSGSATYGDMSLASLLSCLEYELAARHQEAYSCEDVTRLIEEMRKRTGD